MTHDAEHDFDISIMGCDTTIVVEYESDSTLGPIGNRRQFTANVCAIRIFGARISSTKLPPALVFALRDAVEHYLNGE